MHVAYMYTDIYSAALAMWRIWWSEIDFACFSLACHCFCFVFFLWDRVSQWNWISLFQRSWLASKSLGSASLCCIVTDKGHHNFHMGFRDPNSGPHSWAASTLPSEPSPQPQAFLVECPPHPMTSLFMPYLKLFPYNASSGFLLIFQNLTDVISQSYTMLQSLWSIYSQK